MVSGCPFDTPIGAVRVGLVEGAVRRQPDAPAARRGATLEIVVAGTENAVVMVEAGAPAVSARRRSSTPSTSRTRAIKTIIAAQRRLQAIRSASPSRHGRPRSAVAGGVCARIRRAVRRAARRGAARARQARPGTHAVDTVEDAGGRLAPRDRERRERALGQGHLPRHGQGPVPPRHSRPQRASRRPRLRRDPPGHLRGRPAAAHARLGPVHPRRDPGARHRHARHLRGRADHRGARGRARSSASCCTTTSRRSRSARSSSCAAPAAARSVTATSPAARSTPVLPDKDDRSRTRCAWSPTSWSPTAPRRWRPCAAARSSLMDAGVPIAAPVAGIAMGLVSDGSASRSSPTSPARRTTTATWTSRSPAPVRAITALQMDIKIARPAARGHGAGARAGAPRAPAAARHRWTAAIAAAAAGHLRVRAAHHHDHDQPRQDPRRHRTRRQDDPGDPASETGARINVEDDGRVEIATADGEAAKRAVQIIEGAHPPAADRRDLRGHRQAHRAVRRLRRDPAQPGRPAARLRDRLGADPRGHATC